MRGYNYASPGYYGSASASGYYHNSYATIAAALQRQPAASERPHRSNTFSRLPNGYSAGSRGKIIDKPSSSTHQAKRSRHRAESGPASSTVSPLQSGVSSPKGKASSESRRELRVAEADSKQSRDDRRRSTVSRHEAPRRRKKGEHEHSKRRKSHSEKKHIPKHSFAKLTSGGTTPSIRSGRQSTKIKACHKKSNGRYGLFGCFGS
ncbi:hypothetical protein G3M48_006685 [Beauveria asiatica]|uniref:Uncharacterized protein n=1 Tax=Beauveria asiatica TaxID=1069075 RepID=A0AAW0S586_9HYPO